MLLILVAVVLLPTDLDTGRRELAATVAIGGSLALIVSASMLSLILRRGLRGPGAGSTLQRAALVQRLLLWLAVGLVVVAVLGFGLREAVREVIGNPPLIDEILTMAPALVVIVTTWWIFHPFEQHARQSMILRQLDEGVAVQAPPGRVAWLSMQIRTQMLVLLVPLALLALVGEIVRGLLENASGDQTWWSSLISGLAIVPVLLLAPWLVIRIVGARPLPPGEVRSTLEQMCRSAGVRVRNLLLWPTGGTVINAGVTGVVAPLRWVMLTDGLLETLHRRQVMAVMAHELAHARRHHILWMVLAVIALTSGLAFVIDPLVMEARNWRIQLGGSTEDIQRDLEVVDLAAIALVLGGTLAGFGWVSRRFERQADAFAARALSLDPDRGPLPAVSPGGVDAMSTALLAVSDSNGVSSKRFSWRHGSIDSRVVHLRSLVEVEVDALPIDRTVRRINFASSAMVTLVGGWWVLEMMGKVAP